MGLSDSGWDEIVRGCILTDEVSAGSAAGGGSG